MANTGKPKPKPDRSKSKPRPPRDDITRERKGDRRKTKKEKQNA